MGRGRESTEGLGHQGPWPVVGPWPASSADMDFHREVESSEAGKCLLGGKEYVCMLLPPSRTSRVRLCDPIDGSPPGSSVPGMHRHMEIDTWGGSE